MGSICWNSGLGSFPFKLRKLHQKARKMLTESWSYRRDCFSSVEPSGKTHFYNPNNYIFYLTLKKKKVVLTGEMETE